MIFFAAYIAVIVGANWALQTFGLVPVGFGLVAPAGVYFAGLAYVCRNAVQETLGRRWGFAAIAIGAALSAAISPRFALASGLTFLAAETADALVYTGLRRRGLAKAMVAACLAGDFLDSALFLVLAFGSLDHLAGQVAGKWETVSIGLALVWWWRWRRRVVSERAPGRESVALDG